MYKLIIESIQKDWILWKITSLNHCSQCSFMVYRIISQKSVLQFFPKVEVSVWDTAVYQIFPLSSLWHLRYGITEGERIDAAKRWAKCQDCFLNTASQKGIIPNTAQHYHLFGITCPNALCPIFPPSSLQSTRSQLTHLEIQTCRAWIPEV